MKKYYVTTPIYYANGDPHIGHAYSSFIADVIARAKRLNGYQVKFSTGTDENGQKMIQKAESEGKEVLSYLDEISASFKNNWDKLQITYTDYIRTTEPRHHEFVRKMVVKSYENGDIYKGKYEGLYCVGCEAFKKPGDLTPEGLCPDHLKAPNVISEENYFFQLSKYEDQLKDFYKKNPEFIVPDFRFNEIKSFVEAGLEDFSVSRKGNDFRIKFPYGEDEVVYIWYDALFNYLTVCENGDEDFWPADLHVMAKDILRFHGIFWPAMLKSTGYELPKSIFCTGYLTVDGQKMSKSLGNVVEPLKVVEKYGRDAIIFYLFYDVNIGNDGDFSWERFRGVYDSMLLGGWGNLVSRVTKLSEKNGINTVQVSPEQEKLLKQIANNIGLENELVELLFNGFDSKIYENYFDKGLLSKFLKDWYGLVQLANKYVDETQPWTKLKNEDKKDLGIEQLQFLLYLIKNIALLSSPFLIEGFQAIQNTYNNEQFSAIDSTKTTEGFKQFFDTKNFKVNLTPSLLYNRVEH
ncbi:MAG: class I tRNA ligase family protein [Candidatus Absconditabacteria bacterium]